MHSISCAVICTELSTVSAATAVMSTKYFIVYLWFRWNDLSLRLKLSRLANKRSPRHMSGDQPRLEVFGIVHEQPSVDHRFGEVLRGDKCTQLAVGTHMGDDAVPRLMADLW